MPLSSSRPYIIITYYISTQMSAIPDKLVLDPGETVEQRIESILAIMSEEVSEEDRMVLQLLLEQALEMKKKKECQTLSQLKKKYASRKKKEDIINVDDSGEDKKKNPPKKQKTVHKEKGKDHTPPKMKKGTPQKGTVAKEKPTKLKGPPTKRKAPPSPVVSEDGAASGSEYDPHESNSECEDSDAPPITPKRGRPSTKTPSKVTSSSRKRRPRGSRPPLSGCTSESEEGGSTERKKTVILFTKDELKAMYDTAMDDP